MSYRGACPGIITGLIFSSDFRIRTTPNNHFSTCPYCAMIVPSFGCSICCNSYPGINKRIIPPASIQISSIGSSPYLLYATIASIPMPIEVKDINYLLKYLFKLPLSMMPLIAPPGLASFISSTKSTPSPVPPAALR